MLKYNKLLKIILLPIFLGTMMLNTNAQLAPGANYDFQIKLTPNFPAPLSEVRAAVESFTFDPNRAAIQWSINGRVVAEGRGAKEITFSVGPGGSVSTVRVAIAPQEGGSIEKTIEVRPLEVDLLLESSSFVPPWYKGARLVTPYSKVKIVAVPHFIFQGSYLDPETLIYDWRVDGAVRGDLSGRGKRSIVMNAPLSSGGSKEISVKISSALGTLESEAAATIEASRPELAFYERRPLEGLINSEAITNKIIPAGSELEVEAVPFFTNYNSLSELNFSWNFAGVDVAPSPEAPNVFAMRSEPGIRAEATIRLVINNLKNVLEEVRSSFYVRAE